MKHLALAAFLVASSIPVMAQGSRSAVNTDDICSERPDLCGNSASSSASMRNKHVRRAPTSQVECRKKGEPYNLEQASLPICGRSVNDSATGADSSGVREPASVDISPRRISFTSYLNSNANHPAIGGRFGGKQEAFIPVERPAKITGSSTDIPVGDADAAGQVVRDLPVTAPTAPGGGTSAPSTSTSGPGR